tara:strand:- start:785 stop:1195 length:411 start_codon:yes stop_codon:yes gene_type:complete
MEKISDQSLKEKYGEVKFYDMIDEFNEKVSDYKYEDGSGYWREEDDLPVLEDVGFTKEEARYLVYGEQPQKKEEKIILTRPGLSLATAGETLLEIRTLAKKGYQRDEDGEAKEYDDLLALLDEIDIKASEALGLSW